MFLVILLASLLAITAAVQHAPLQGAILAAQSRCQGFLCPNWAMDVSRYDTVEYPNEQFEYLLNENLPLGPTSERGFDTFTAYNSNTRKFYSCASNYPVKGVDSHWVHTVNDYANATSPLFTNVIIAHPDARPNSPGTIELARVLYRDDDALFSIFSDGTVTSLDLASQKHTTLGSLFQNVGFTGSAKMSYAHVMDGSVIKSFILDNQGNSYLVKMDTSVTPPTISVPLKINYIKGMTLVTPIAAHMMNTNDAQPLTLTVVLAGNFDQVQFVDETTGDLIYLVNDLSQGEGVVAMLECNEDTKDCDFWRTSSFDKDNHILYIQAHSIDAEGTPSEAMLKIGFSQSKINGEYYPYINTAMWPMNFGYSGYEYVTIKQQ